MKTNKFRCWDADAEQYTYSTDEPSNPSLDGEYYWGFEKGEIKVYVCTTETPSDYHEAPYPSSEALESPVEQFTGLLDKNGVEIYQGSQVLVTWDDGEIERYTIDWSDELWGFCLDTGARIPHASQIEVTHKEKP